MEQQNLSRELHRIITATVIYRPGEDGKTRYLVIKRSPQKKNNPNQWGLPGGGLSRDDYVDTPPNHGKNAWRGVIGRSQQREIKEEVGVIIGPTTFLFDFAFIRKSDDVSVLALVCYAPYATGDVKLDEDSVDYKWVTLAEAAELAKDEETGLIPGIYDELVEVDTILKKQA